ncbi:hypothetical protein SLEP1_g47596 [Rubroshorea leprosula]|uniref:Uncharacterized protein n=1 Tax=Rubroshorea leprosula TaxID=152421 RepID=A0AAV5LT92_9ROSI|nr:hypothetical protein SLEP1_g47596 [Rubroshorea leprosula]
MHVVATCSPFFPFLCQGMLMLQFNPHQIDGILYLALALLSVNNAGEEYMNKFLIDQLAVSEEQVTDDAGNPNNPIDGWGFIARVAGAAIGGVLTSSKLPIRNWPFIPAILVGIGCVFFYSYRICYEVSSRDHQGEKHELRPLLKLLPLWAPFLIYYVVDAAGSTLFNYEVYLYIIRSDQDYLFIIQKSSGIIVSRLIGYIITKFYSEVNQKEQQSIRLVKITFGMLVCFLFCIDTWHLEAKGKSEGCLCKTKVISLIFILQLILLGIMKEMVKPLLGEYFCDQVPDQSMHHLEFTFNSFVEGLGRLLAVVCILVFRNWISEIADNRHLDIYCKTLAFMSLCALLLFVYLSNTRYWKKEVEDHDDDHLEKLEEGSLSLSSSQPSESQSSFLHSSSVSQSTAYFSGDESISASSEAAVLPNLESAGSSVHKDYWSIVKRYQRCHGFLRYINESLGAKEKSS